MCIEEQEQHEPSPFLAGVQLSLPPLLRHALRQSEDGERGIPPSGAVGVGAQTSPALYER